MKSTLTHAARNLIAGLSPYHQALLIRVASSFNSSPRRFTMALLTPEQAREHRAVTRRRRESLKRSAVQA